MANKGTIKTGFERSGTGYMFSSAYEEGQVYLCSTILDWEIKSQDVVNGTSAIAWKLSVDCSTLGDYDTDATYITVGGSTSVGSSLGTHYSGTVAQTRVEDGETKQIASGEFTVSHDSNGARTLNNFQAITDIFGIYDEDGTSVSSVSSATNLSGLSLNVVLDSIPRHAVLLSAPEKFTDEDSPTITFAIPNGATNVRAYIAFNTSTIDIGSYAVSGSSYTFRFTDAEKRKLWSILDQGLTTKQMYFYVMSEFQGELYHSGPIISTLEVGNYKPTLSPEVWDSNTDVVNRLTGNQYILVKGISNASYTTGGSARKGATIDTQVTTNGGISKHGASGVFEKVTGNVFDFVITDSRGNSTPATMEFSKAAGRFIDYVKLTCSTEVTEMTADGDVQVRITGKCFNGSFGKLTNRLRVNYDIAENGGDFTHVDLGYASYASNYGNSYSISGNDYTYTLNLTNLNYLSVYDLTIRVSDEVEVEGVPASTIVASTPIFDWGRTDFNFNVPVTIQGGSVPTIVAQGTAGIWTYRTWSDGTAECWGKKDFTVNVTSAWGGMYTSGAISGSNISFPFGLFAETPIVNASLLVRSAGGILMAPGGAGSNIANMDQTGVYEIARGTSLSNAAYTINYQVIGRWK